MKTLITLTLLLCLVNVYGQQPIMKYLPMFGASIVKGGLDGTIESLRFHPSQTAKLFGTTQDKIDPAYTWPNKYKNGDPSQGERFFLSTSLLVGFTDTYHTVRSINNFTGIYLPVFYPTKQTKLDKWLIIPAIQFVGQSIGFSIMEAMVKNQH